MVERGRYFPALAENRIQIFGNSNENLVTILTEKQYGRYALWLLMFLLTTAQKRTFYCIFKFLFHFTF